MNAFRALGDIILNNKKKRDIENQEFLKFFRELVETLPAEACKKFGQLTGVDVIVDNTAKQFGIILSVTDFLWWRNAFETTNVRFTNGPENVKMKMLERLTAVSEVDSLGPADRKKILAILIEAKEGTKQ